MVKLSTNSYIDALNDVLKSRFPANTFSLNGYQECSTCMQFMDGNWVIFDGERGNRYDEIYCDTILQVCLAFIRRMTHRKDDISAMENELNENISAEKIA